MRTLLIILIVSAVLNAETAAPVDCCPTLDTCTSYVTDLEDQSKILTDTLRQTTKERDDSVSQLAHATPPLLPWYAYGIFGFVTGGLAAFAATR